VCCCRELHCIALVEDDRDCSNADLPRASSDAKPPGDINDGLSTPTKLAVASHTTINLGTALREHTRTERPKYSRGQRSGERNVDNRFQVRLDSAGQDRAGWRRVVCAGEIKASTSPVITSAVMAVF